MKPATPKKKKITSTKHAYLIKRIALGSLLTEIKVLKSFKFFKSSDYDFESDFYYF